jgi:alpha/beta superfamily hydrolase
MPSYNLDPKAIATLWQSIFKPEAVLQLEPKVTPDWLNTAFSMEMAVQMAQLSHLIYTKDKEERQGAAQQLTLRETASCSIDAMHWSRFESSESPNNASIICFRGTTDPIHWLYNLNALLIEWPSIGHVHRGFAKAFGKLQDSLQQELAERPAETLIMTGHSLGAALAMLFASLTETQQVYTFGAPRPGTASFAQTLNRHCPVHRVVHGLDMVTQLPQHWPILERRAFVHPGEVVHLQLNGSSAKGADAALPEPDHMLRDSLRAMVDGDRLAEPVPALLDHAPINYVKALASAL